MGSTRKFIGGVVVTAVLLLSLAAIGLTVYLDTDGESCFITALQTGKLWFRGGIYKFVQLMALLVPAVAWAVVGGLVTSKGLEANSAVDPYAQPEDTANQYPADEACRIALMCVTIAAAALLALAFLLRAVEQPGHVQRAELEGIEAERRADMAIADLRKRRGLDAFRDLGGINNARKELSAEFLAGFQSKHTYNLLCDGSDPKDTLYMPRHPRWYGRWLLATRKDLSTAPFMPNVLNQGNLGTCVAHAAANAYRFALVKEARHSQAYMPSRLFIYFNSRAMNNVDPLNWAAGTHLRAAFLSVQKYGACDERLYHYMERALQYRPSEKAYADAESRRHNLKPIKLFASNFMDPHEKIYTIMSALSRGHPIACGLHIYLPRMEKLGEDGQGVVLNYPRPEELALRKRPDSGRWWGGHAVLLVGYDQKAGWFKFQNSWGWEWGAGGYFYTGVGYLMNPHLSSDFWMFND